MSAPFCNRAKSSGTGFHEEAAPAIGANIPRGAVEPAGSFVVMTAQAFRPHIMDMFEPQDHPDNIPYPGAPPTPPYDHAGWTLAFTPGSILTAKVDVSNPIAHGLKEQTDIFFDNSPVFRLSPGAASQNVTALAWFDTATPLESGWSWGQKYLQGGVAAIEARMGKGRVVLFGPEIIERAQPHATFKFLFNAIYYAAATTPAADGIAGRRGLR